MPGLGQDADSRTRQIPVHVYTLQSFLAGVLRTDRPRITDALNGPAAQIALLDVVAARYDGANLRHYGDRAWVQKSSVFFVCDRPSDGYRPQHGPIARDHERVYIALSCGPFFIEGRAHLPPGSDLETRVFDSPSRFIPLTDASIRFPEMPLITEHTVLVNRDRIDYVIAGVISYGEVADAPQEPATRPGGVS